MAKAQPKASLFNAPGFSFADGVLTVKHGGAVAITEGSDGSWSYTQGANTYVITSAEVDQIATINVANGGTTLQLSVNALVGDSFTFTGKGDVEVNGLSFTTADQAANYKFEPNVNLDSFIAGELGPAQTDVAGALDALTDMFGQTNAFRLLWDFVDDNYSYYNTPINTVGVELGLAYAEYLQAGGAPITDIAKYAPDGADAGTAPDRAQKMHDNLLGNLDINSIVDKFFDGNSANGSANVPDGYATNGSNATPDEATGQALIDAIVNAGLAGRPYYGGYEGTDPGPTIAFDYAHGLI